MPQIGASQKNKYRVCVVYEVLRLEEKKYASPVQQKNVWIEKKTQYVRQGVFRKATLFHPKSKVHYPRRHNEKLHMYALSIQRAAFLKKCFTY